MAQTVCPLVSAADRARLASIAADRDRPPKHAARARIILHSAAHLDVATIAREVGLSRPAVWRWQQRYAEEGVEGLLRERSRKPGRAPTPSGVVRHVMALTRDPPPGEATHWTGRAMADATGLSLRTVQRIWEAHDLKPHRVRALTRPKNPDFVARLEDVVGLYVDPPRRALVLALGVRRRAPRAEPAATPASPTAPAPVLADITIAGDGTPPDLMVQGPDRLSPICPDTIGGDGPTTLCAALERLHGKVVGRGTQRRGRRAFIRFLDTVDDLVPAGKAIHVVLDSDTIHRHAQVQRWLVRHPRWTLHVTPATGAWLDAVMRFCGTLARRPSKRGDLRSLPDLIAAIDRFVARHDQQPGRFVWRARSRPRSGGRHPGVQAAAAKPERRSS